MYENQKKKYNKLNLIKKKYMDLLKDPTNDRMVKTLKPPPHRPLSRNLMFPEKLKSF